MRCPGHDWMMRVIPPQDDDYVYFEMPVIDTYSLGMVRDIHVFCGICRKRGNERSN